MKLVELNLFKFYRRKQFKTRTKHKKHTMAPNFLLIALSLSVIQISNAQIDDSNRRKIDEESKIIFIDSSEYSNEPRGYSPKSAFPLPPRTGCGLRNIGDVESTITSAAAAVCMLSFYFILC